MIKATNDLTMYQKCSIQQILQIIKRNPSLVLWQIHFSQYMPGSHGVRSHCWIGFCLFCSLTVVIPSQGNLVLGLVSVVPTWRDGPHVRPDVRESFATSSNTCKCLSLIAWFHHLSEGEFSIHVIAHSIARCKAHSFPLAWFRASSATSQFWWRHHWHPGVTTVDIWREMEATQRTLSGFW